MIAYVKRQLQQLQEEEEDEEEEEEEESQERQPLPKMSANVNTRALTQSSLKCQSASRQDLRPLCDEYTVQ